MVAVCRAFECSGFVFEATFCSLADPVSIEEITPKSKKHASSCLACVCSPAASLCVSSGHDRLDRLARDPLHEGQIWEGHILSKHPSTIDWEGHQAHVQSATWHAAEAGENEGELDATEEQEEARLDRPMLTCHVALNWFGCHF